MPKYKVMWNIFSSSSKKLNIVCNYVTKYRFPVVASRFRRFPELKLVELSQGLKPPSMATDAAMSESKIAKEKPLPTEHKPSQEDTSRTSNNLNNLLLYSKILSISLLDNDFGLYGWMKWTLPGSFDVISLRRPRRSSLDVRPGKLNQLNMKYEVTR